MKGFDLVVPPFLEALDVASAVIDKFTSEESKYGIKFSKTKGVQLMAVSGNATVNISLDSCVTVHDGDFAFGFDPTLLRQVLNRRAKVEVEYTKNNQFKLFSRTKSGSYNGEIVTQEFIEDVMTAAGRRKVTGDKGKRIDLDKSAVSEILRAIKFTSISAVHEASHEINSLIKITGNNIQVATTDTYHMAIYKGSSKHKGLTDMQLALPATYFLLFGRAVNLKFAADEKPTLTLNGSKSVTFSSKSYELTLPAIQVEKAHFDQLFTKMDEVSGTKPQLSFSIEHSRVNDAINNLSAIYEQGAFIGIEASGKDDKGKAKVHFKTESGYGKLNDSVVVDNCTIGKFKGARLDPKTFMDSMRLLDSVIKLSIVNVVGKNSNTSVYYIEQRLDDDKAKVSHIGLLV